MNVIRTAALAAVALALSACASIQQTSGGGPLNYDAQPNYGTMSLAAGFTPDPRVVSLRAGGDVDARSLHSTCSGYVTSAPDVRLNYQSGSLPLIVSVAANADTTLVVNAPDGSWYCNDDGGVNGLNPSVRFNSPMSGRYEIWVGTYQAGATQPARLHVSEVSSQ